MDRAASAPATPSTPSTPARRTAVALDSVRPGLTPEEAQARLDRCGPNRLFTPEPVRLRTIAAEEIREPMILLLLAVGVLYAIWGSLGDAVAIVVIIALLVLAEVLNEFRAKRAIVALEALASPSARVRRAGQVQALDASCVVPGDLLLLAPGARLVADATLRAAWHMGVDESALTGESLPVDKHPGDPLHAGSVVVTGEGEAQVTATGGDTRLGRMATELVKVKPPRTPLQLAMKALAGRLVWVAVSFAAAVTLIGMAQGRDVREMLLTGLSLAFAVVPEELPIIVTMVLGLGAWRLSQRKLLVKRLRAAETLGDTSVILTDKTGTLTENRLRVADAWPPAFESDVLRAALGTVSPEVPDALEQAVLARAEALGLHRPGGAVVDLRHPGHGRPSKAALWQLADGTRQLDVTGAPEDVFARCRELFPGTQAQLESQAALGRRVIAVARRPVPAEAVGQPLDVLERSLSFVGLLALGDPPRAGVQDTLAQAAAAGIRTVMVSGDHPATARAIAKEVGLPAESVLTGDDLDGLDDHALANVVRDTAVFARATPQHKLRLLRALQAQGEVVAVTGDGVNDALALKAADVGVAMGRRGTDVAREAAQAVLVDDDYASLARGIFEGRRFHDNLRKGVHYYLAVKAGLIAIFLLPVLAGLPLPFAPIQIIVLELFMDLAASAGFVAEPAQADVARRPPHRRDAPLIDRAGVIAILCKGALLFAAVMAAYAWALWRHLPPAGVQTCAFVTWMAAHVALAYASRSDHGWIGWRNLFGNPVMNAWAAAATAFVVLALTVAPLRNVMKFGAI